MAITPETTVVFQHAEKTKRAAIDWPSAWPDALAFVVGLAVARWSGWTAGDLIWSLWLSSLVVGYATIVWIIGRGAAGFAIPAWKARNDGNGVAVSWLLALTTVGASFMLAFFTVHFGGFHYVHSQILLHFFPIETSGIGRPGWAGKAVYLEIFRRYWIFLPSAFLSHRAAFLPKPGALDNAGALKLASTVNKQRDMFAEPYRNVLRMHGLIFFFFLAHFAGLENFAVYTAIYVVYFFPWRLLRSET